MYKLYKAIAALFILTVCSCSSYDDSDIRGGLSDLENRVSQLETLCSQTNSNINALQAIVNALQQKEFVESVNPLADGQGYTLTFSSGKTVTIYNGKDGKDGEAPLIGVRQNTDGLWYWTVNGDWLRDGDGNMVKAAGTDGEDGEDGVTPKMKIEEGMWYVSYDDGLSWKQLGKATGEDGASAGIISVTEEDGYVRFGMQDGTVISVVKRKALGISFNKADVAIISGGMTRTITYKLTGASDDAVVKTLSQDGWKAKASQPEQSSGTITITSPDPIVESEVIVLVSDGCQVLMASINCMKAEIVISNEQYDVSADGGTFSLSVQSNTDFNVSIPEKSESWLSVVQTKSMSTSTFEISVSANRDAVIRNAVVKIVDDSDNVMRTFFVSQAAYMDGVVSIHVDSKGGLNAALEASYDKSNIIRMKITGVLGDDDFKTMREEMPELRYLDISDVDMETLPERCFYRSTNVTTVLLPKNLNSIPYSGGGCFEDSRISGNLVIPSLCTLIGEDAFEGCSALESVSIPSSVQEIGAYAFDGCTSLNLVTFVGSDGLQKIGEKAFIDCSSLKTFYMPSTVTEYGDEIFYGCSSLSSFTGANAKENGSFIIVDDEVKCYAPGYDWPYVDQWGISMKKIAVPDYVKKDFLAGETEWYRYRENADTIFAANDGKIKYLSVPGSKTKIYTAYLNSQGFSGLENLLYAYFNCEYLPYGNDGGLDISTAPEWEDDVDYSSGIIGNLSFLCGANLLTVEFGPDVRQIERCICGCPKLVNIHLNEGLKRILNSSLWMLNSLTELKIPDSVEHIGFYCLGHCFNLRKLYFGKGLKYIGEYVLSTIFGAGQNHLQSFYIAAPEPPAGYPIYTINPGCKIYVPAESYDLYLNHENWSMYASQLYPFDYTDFDFNLAQ